MNDNRNRSRVLLGSVVPLSILHDDDIFHSISIPDRPDLRAKAKYFIVDLKPYACPSLTLIENNGATTFGTGNCTESDEHKNIFDCSQEPPTATTSCESYYSCQSSPSYHEAKLEENDSTYLPSDCERKGNKETPKEDLANYITIVNTTFLNSCIDEFNQNYKLVTFSKPNTNCTFNRRNFKDSVRPSTISNNTSCSDARSLQFKKDIGVTLDNRCCKENNATIPLATKYHTPAQDLQEDANCNNNLDIREVLSAQTNSSFSEESLVRFEFDGHPNSSKESNSPISVFQIKDKENVVTHPRKQVQIQLPQIKFVETAPIWDKGMIPEILKTADTDFDPENEKEGKLVIECENVAPEIKPDSSSTIVIKTSSKCALFKGSEFCFSKIFCGDGDFSSKRPLQNDNQPEDQSEPVLQNITTSYLKVLIGKSLKKLFNEPEIYLNSPVEKKYSSETDISYEKYELPNKTSMFPYKYDQRVTSLSLQNGTVSLKSPTVQLYTTENVDDDSFGFEDSSCFPTTKNTTDVSSVELNTLQVNKRYVGEFKRKCFQQTSSLSDIQEESSQETLEGSSTSTLNEHFLKSSPEQKPQEFMDGSYPVTLGKNNFQNICTETSLEIVDEGLQKSIKDFSLVDSEALNKLEESRDSSKRNMDEDYCLVDDNGRPIHLFDSRGLPLTDNSGRPLKSAEGNLLLNCDEDGLPAVDSEVCDIYDAAGRQPHDEHFDPSLSSTPSPSHKLTTSDGHPLLLYDEQGRPLTTDSGTMLLDSKGRPLVHITTTDT